MSRMMALMPMPLEGMMEFHETEMARINALPQAAQYNELASLSRVRELSTAVNEGYSTPEMRAELEHRFANDPYFQNMVDAGRTELANRPSPYDEDSPAFLRDGVASLTDFMMTAEIATLAKMDVMDMHYHGLKARQEEYGDLSPEEAEFVANIDGLSVMQYLNNPATELGDMIMNPETASVEPEDMKAGFEEFAGVINSFLRDPAVHSDVAQAVGGKANALNAASSRSIMNNGFTVAAEGQTGDALPENDPAPAQNATAPAAGM